METMVIVPNNGLDKERQWAEMTLMGYGCNKLQKKLKSHHNVKTSN